MAAATGAQEKELVDQLKGVPLFARTTAKQRKSLVKLGKVLKWKEGATPIEEGSKGAAFFLLLEGSAEVVKGDARVAVVSAGDFVGELALLANTPRTATVVALSDCVVFALGRPGLSAALKGDHQMALAMLEAIAARQANTL